MRTFLILFSRLPFWILHRFSNLAYFVIFHLLGYRKAVAFQNLKKSFPEKSEKELRQIQRKFFRNFCDLIFETVKTFTISKEAILQRCQLDHTEVMDRLFRENKSLIGISSHLGNWEWLSLSFALSLSHSYFPVYKPLSNRTLNGWMLQSRDRFGGRMTPIKALKSVFEFPHQKPIAIGLLADQSPHDHSRAFEFTFLNQPTFFVPGPGVITVQKNFTPILGWMRRVGRSRYRWFLEEIPEREFDRDSVDSVSMEQVKKISSAHGLSEEQSIRAFQITRYYVRRLEEEIKMAPQDWLWSHRRWKIR